MSIFTDTLRTGCSEILMRELIEYLASGVAVNFMSGERHEHLHGYSQDWLH